MSTVARVVIMITSRDDKIGAVYFKAQTGDRAGFLKPEDMQLTDVPLRQTLGAAARERAVRDYSWAAHCRALEEAIKGARSA